MGPHSVIPNKWAVPLLTCKRSLVQVQVRPPKDFPIKFEESVSLILSRPARPCPIFCPVVSGSLESGERHCGGTGTKNQR
jgi:hypothetical protein